MLPYVASQKENPPMQYGGPPQPTDEQILKGGHALRQLKNYSDNLYQVNLDLQGQLQNAQETIKRMFLEKDNLQAELQDKNDKIALLRQKDFKGARVTRGQEETERLLEDEMRKRLRAEQQYKSLLVTLEKTKEAHEQYKRNIEARDTHQTEQELIIVERNRKIAELELFIKNLEFDLDEQRVLAVKFQRKSEELDKSLSGLTQKHESLLKTQAVYRDENAQLQKRMRELLDANKEVTANYQAVKRNQDLKRSEFEELATELDEAKNACQLAIRQKRQLQNELNQLIKQRTELTDKNKQMEALLARKEKDITELLTKVNDTINDYEAKLERKEEQMWALSVQMAEAGAGLPGLKSGGGEVTTGGKKSKLDIDADFIDNIEKKWQAKEKMLQGEMERLAHLLRAKEETVKELNDTVADLSQKQFQPRMERLKAIEKDIKNKLEEYALAEERMETGFLCPRDVQLYQTPMTLVPCGHTYCKHCLDAIKEENYNITKCQVCTSAVDHVFRNEQLEAVEEQFVKRKSLTLSFLNWIKMLKVYLPTDDSEEGERTSQ